MYIKKFYITTLLLLFISSVSLHAIVVTKMSSSLSSDGKTLTVSPDSKSNLDLKKAIASAVNESNCSIITKIIIKPLPNNTKIIPYSDISNIFNLNLSSLEYIEGLDHINTANVTNITKSFLQCTALKNLDLSSWDVSNVSTCYCTFSDCKSLEYINVSNWNTSNFTTIYHMFRGCNSLMKIDGINEWNTHNITNFDQLFKDCYLLESIDPSSWNTESAVNFSYLFNNCRKLVSLDLSAWDLSNANTIQNMFDGCTSLESLDISTWSLMPGISQTYTFYNIPNLSEIKLSGSFPKSLSDNLNCISGTKWVEESELFITSNLSKIPTYKALDGKEYAVPGAYYSQYIVSSDANTSTLPKAKVFLCNDNVDLIINADASYRYISAGINTNIIINTGTNIFAEQIILKSEGDTKTSQLHINGNLSDNSKVELHRKLNNSRYYFLSLPYACNVSDITLADGSSIGTFGVDWDIVYYDELKRATNYDDLIANPSWTHLSTSSQITPGMGLNIAIASDSELELAFPMAPSASINESANAIVQFSDLASTPNAHKGWNLIGHSRLSNYKGEITLSNGSPINYISYFNGTSYDQCEANSLMLIPNVSFFVQVAAGGNVSFSNNTPLNVPSFASNDNIKRISLILSHDSISHSDKTTLLLSNNLYSNDYEIGADLQKMISRSSVPQIFAHHDSVDHAFIALPDSSLSNVYIAYHAPISGQYNISLGNDYNLNTDIYLIDNYLNISHNLSLGTYSFSANQGEENNSRFYLSYNSGVVTDNNASQLHNYIVSAKDNTISIENITPNAKINVLNALGQQIFNGIASSSSLNINVNQKGIYIIQITENENQNTIKITL